MIVDLEVTNTCNMHCGFCPREKLTRPVGFLDIQQLPMFVDYILRRNPQQVHLTGFGEPFLHPALDKIVSTLSNAGLRVLVTTNGSMACPERLQALLKAGIKHFFVSHTAPVHPEHHLDAFRGLEQYTSVVAVKSNISDMDRTAKETMGFAVNTVECHNRGDNVSEEICLAPPKNMLGKHCSFFRDIEFIAWNGDILPCCNDLVGYVIGNVADGELVNRSGIVNFPICERCSM